MAGYNDDIGRDTTSGQVFDFLENRDDLNLFDSEIDFSDSIINKLPNNASFGSIMDVINSMMDSNEWALGGDLEYSGVSFNPANAMKDVFNKINESDTLRTIHPRILDDVSKKIGILQETEPVESDTFNYLDEVINEEFRNYSIGRKLGGI